MNDMVITIDVEFELKVKELVVRLLKLGDASRLRVDTDLVQQLGLDSIEAIDAIATLHELLDVAIPRDFNPRVTNSVRSLARYVAETLGPDAAKRLRQLDLDAPGLFSDGDL